MVKNLENEPNDMFEKHLVAVSSYALGNESHVAIRQTTLMPHIRVFTPLMAAIFAPCTELKRNAKNTHYTTMISGLGCDTNGKPVAPQNDMIFHLDAEISNKDLLLANKNLLTNNF